MITHSKRWMVPLSLAASILLLLAVTILFRMGLFSPAQPFGSISDPDLAYTETCKALEMVSIRFNTGLEKAKDLDAFAKGINKAEKLKQFNQYQPISIHQDEH